MGVAQQASSIDEVRRRWTIGRRFALWMRSEDERHEIPHMECLGQRQRHSYAPILISDARAGHFVLRTSHTEWSVVETVRTYWRFTELEATFRSLKSEHGLRSVWNQLGKGIEGHLFIAVLALYGVNVISIRIAAQWIHYRWATLRDKLSRWLRGTAELTTTGGSRIDLICDFRPSSEATAIARAAGMPYASETRIRRLAKRKQY